MEVAEKRLIKIKENELNSFVKLQADAVEGYNHILYVLDSYNIRINDFEELEDMICIDLTCDKDMQPYYERFGMLKSYSMVIRKYL